MRTIFICIITVFIASCSCTYHMKRAQSKCGPLKQFDSISVREKITIEYRDSIIYISETGPVIYKDNPCDSLGNLRPFHKEEKKNGLVTTLKSDGKKLTAECRADSLQAVIDSLKTVTREKEVIHRTIIEKPLHVRTGWESFCIWWFWISAAALAGYLSVKKMFRKMKLPF